jgi:hypothetical protein
LDRLGNAELAVQATRRRFGDSTSLRQELQASVPTFERLTFNCLNPKETIMSRWWIVGVVGPLTASAVILPGSTEYMIGALSMLAAVGLVRFSQTSNSVSNPLIAFRPIIAIVPFIFIDTFLLGSLYFKLRDAMCGTTWAGKSLRRAILYEALIALVAFGTGIGFNAVATSDPSRAIQTVYVSLAAAAAATIAFPLLARVNGPGEIADTVWACLKLDGVKPEVA